LEKKMAHEEQYSFPADDELTDAAHLRIELERIYLDGRVRRSRIPGPMRLITSLTELFRHLLSKAHP
jgi:hypothetical protein